MRGSLKLFTLFRIPVHIHWSFGLIFMYALWIAFSNHFGIIDTVWLLGFFVSLFGCVLLHEYGHILTARKYGIHTQDIILTPIGGIARLERMPEKPLQEFVVAIAGPMVNVVIAGLLFLLGFLVFQNERWELFKWFLNERLNIFAESDEMDSVILDSGLDPSGLLMYLPLLLTANIILVVFNLIPAFPMDGGRIVRALLAMRIGRSKATNIAALIGQGFAILFILYGLYNPESWSLTLIGFFVFVTARSENAMVQLDDLLRRFKARDVMRPQFTRLLSTDWMQTPIDLLGQGLERHFLVFDLDGRLAGFLEEDDIQVAQKKRDLSSEVSRYAQKDVEIVHPNESLQYVYFLIRQKGNGIVGIADETGLIGVVDEAGLSYFLKSQAGKK